MVSLIDTNVIVRFLAEDHPEHLLKSQEVFRQVQAGTLHIEIMSEVVMEVLHVLTKFYSVPQEIVIEKLIKLLSLRGVVNRDKALLTAALETMVRHRIDYVDALICAKTQLQGYEWISFDADLTKHC